MTYDFEKDHCEITGESRTIYHEKTQNFGKILKKYKCENSYLGKFGNTVMK